MVATALVLNALVLSTLVLNTLVINAKCCGGGNPLDKDCLKAAPAGGH